MQGSGHSARRKLASKLTDATLTSGGTIEGLDYSPVAMMTDVRVLKIGGQSLMDRGREALFPVLDEVVAAGNAPSVRWLQKG